MDRDIMQGNTMENREVEKFKASPAYETVTKYIALLDKEIQESKTLGDTKRDWDLGRSSPGATTPIHAFLQRIKRIIDEVPLEEDDQRYGNRGFIVFLERVTKEGSSLIKEVLLNGGASKTTEALATYLEASFGNKTRIDYGTGHELNFFCFLIVLHTAGLVATQELFSALEHYFALVRLLILKYKLEPAGSHGNWGIDDYQLLPFLLGSSQFCKRNDLSFASLFESKHKDLCFSKALRFVHVHKSCSSLRYTFEERIAQYEETEVTEEPFEKHSPMIYSLKDVPFSKINRGMIKMYDGVVLSKYVVIQHFIGSDFLQM
ncbi:serine/threonine-protein phosphatase 2A activator [Nematocida displodere]|uniref:Serine/threonine-protein phosphatase 2A activator n=1 Tax=Nematocida displodere TaxID=1805483 RepID=A0A177EEH8_9MICR|nr:serine/threonine-protein phosphatase 2A activator [Nematocida displodere]